MQIDLADDGHVFVDVDETGPGVARAARVGDVIKSSMSSIEAALTPVCDTAAAAMRAFRTRLPAPEEIEIGFGVRLTAEAGAVIAKSGVEAHLNVTVRWAGAARETATGTSDAPEAE
jgi:hypothetical protein